ncbi:uncharacterized protein LOC111072290 isoform X2 [Drosophila obscura]|nr:uncharacterized protein LOC111072290 isoform X2 [Drosophila obscura]XP_041451612.1 uncharacterized protein LOC111072290 isoform X2 [Drosophila obscura]XP_041451613.1 uncharacterized protein LOC111072290 isoform X2 [Drosophila obscura]XP_041451614.1 uncharacterized protein LOC111072290 isoform X2 [Drosophila obscura]
MSMESKPRTCPWLMVLLLLGTAMPLPPAAGGSCREAQLCCNGRDSSCVVQKAPVNAIIEDLSDKPCYCDHACLKLGDCCDDFKDHCGVLDCQASDWGAWSECDKSCGNGLMTRSRQILQVAQNGGKHCPTLFQTRGCQGFRCHGHREKKILREMALLLPAALSHNVNSSAIRRNRRSGYRDSYSQKWDHEYCVEFEVLKASKACHKLPPYNLMLEGDRIIVRCDLEALIQDGAGSSSTTVARSVTPTAAATTTGTYKEEEERSVGSDAGEGVENSSNSNNYSNSNDDDDEDNNNEEGEVEDEDVQNMLDTGSNENYESRHQRQSQILSHRDRPWSSTKRSAMSATLPPAPTPSFHCRGEGLSGRTMRWSALPAPSCRGKWLRLTVGPPKKCNYAQFIFV